MHLTSLLHSMVVDVKMFNGRKPKIFAIVKHDLEGIKAISKLILSHPQLTLGK